MTLQEIFKSVRFEDMVKYLIDIESQVFENLYCFKEAFDVLRMMEAKEGRNIPIEIERVIDDFDEEPFLSVSFKVREEWDCMLSRIVEVNENTDATIQEIAIHEYAHHIHATEWWRGEFKGKYDAMHGYNFWFIYNKLINLAFQKGYNINPKSYGIGTDFYNIYIRKFNQIDSNNFKKNIRL